MLIKPLAATFCLLVASGHQANSFALTGFPLAFSFLQATEQNLSLFFSLCLQRSG
jgi:hypothetical protein